MPIFRLVAAALCGGAFTASRAAGLALLPLVLTEGGWTAAQGAPAALLSLVAVFGPILSALFPGEQPGPLQVAGGGIVLVGGAVATRRPPGPSGPYPQGGPAR